MNKNKSGVIVAALAFFGTAILGEYAYRLAERLFGIDSASAWGLVSVGVICFATVAGFFSMIGWKTYGKVLLLVILGLWLGLGIISKVYAKKLKQREKKIEVKKVKPETDPDTLNIKFA